jgi:hypothetical protein
MKSIHEQILEERQLIIEQKSDEIEQAIKEGQEIDEGFLATMLGGLAGVTAGASIMKAVCKALGLEKGMIYDLLTSKLVCGIAGSAIANSIVK